MRFVSICLLACAFHAHLLACGTDEGSVTATATDEGGDGVPPDCASDPTGDLCRAAFDEACQMLTTKEDCQGAPGVGEGNNLWCAWLEPVRWTIEDGTCVDAPEPTRCVGGFFVGEGGEGCEFHVDPDDEGPGSVLGASERCAGPYDWTPCTREDAPPECTCVEL